MAVARRIAVHVILEAVGAALESLPENLRRDLNEHADRFIMRFSTYLQAACQHVPKLWRQAALNEATKLTQYLEEKVAEALDVPPPNSE